jgi:hypothetical protein
VRVAPPFVMPRRRRGSDRLNLEEIQLTGVARPKMLTITFTLPRSLLTSSTTPENALNGPSTTRT